MTELQLLQQAYNSMNWLIDELNTYYDFEEVTDDAEPEEYWVALEVRGKLRDAVNKREEPAETKQPMDLVSVHYHYSCGHGYKTSVFRYLFTLKDMYINEECFACKEEESQDAV